MPIHTPRLVLFLSLLLLPVLVRAELSGHGGPVKGVAVSPDGATALTAGFDYSVMLWELAAEQATKRLIGHDAAVNSIAYVPGGMAVSSSDDGTVALWDLAAGALSHRFNGHAGRVPSVAVTRDGKVAASAGWDRTVRLWDLERRVQAALFEDHHANVNAVAFSPDGKLLASGDYDSVILIRSVPDGAALKPLVGHDFGVNALAFAPDGKHLVSGSSDKSVRLWNIEAMREATVLKQHDAPVFAVAVAPDGTIGASGAADGSIRLWRLDGQGAELPSIRGLPRAVWSLAFTPDGQRLLAAGGGGTVKIWNLADGSEVGHEGGGAKLSSPPDPADPGARLFRKCAACHTLTPDGGSRAGPTLYGVFGRRAGSVPGYPYSPALRDSQLVWDEHTIDDLFDLGPDQVTPGSKMPLQRMTNQREREELIEFLKRATRPRS